VKLHCSQITIKPFLTYHASRDNRHHTKIHLNIDSTLHNLKACGIGCHIHEQYFGCLFYADDLILLSPSVAGLQDMLNLCFETAASLDLNFNVNKSHCISFGKSAALKIDPMKIGSCEVAWCSSIKYLGVYIVSGKRISFDIDPIKRAFYSACNCVFSHAEKNGRVVTFIYAGDFLSTNSIICLSWLFI
jgi:hypothetical protein